MVTKSWCYGDGDDPGSVVNFVIRTMIKAMAVKAGPMALIACHATDPRSGVYARRCSRVRLPVSDHSKLGEGEGHEDTNDVQLDDRADVGLEGHDQGDGKQSKQDDAVAVDEAVAAVMQLAGHEAVGGKQGGQQREAVEGGVGGQDQDGSWSRTVGSRRGDRSQDCLGRSARARFGWVCRRAVPGRWGSRLHGPGG